MDSTATRKFRASAMSLAGKSDLSKVSARQSACRDKTQLKLSLGDPTFDGNFKAPEAATLALCACAQTPTKYSYQRSWGTPEACNAVAEWWAKNFATEYPEACKGENVMLTTGGAEAILTTITALCDEGDNLLVPGPGFPLYSYCCDTFNIEERTFHLMPDHNWEVDLDEVRRLVDDRTKAIVLINPSNPCGSNWRREHIEAIVRLCEDLKLPIITDEIYCGMVFKGEVFTSFAQIRSPVPRFIVCGLAKNFMLPGWRMGWVMLVDPNGYAADVWRGMQTLSKVTMGPCVLTMHALPTILRDTPREYFTRNTEELESNAQMFAKGLSACHGLSCAEPQGSLYIMFQIHFDQFKDFTNDVEFYMALEDEENVQVIPGSYVGIPGFVRICFSRDRRVLEEVMERLPAFCQRHSK